VAEGSGRILLGDNTGEVDGHAAADQVPLRRSLGLNCGPFYIHTHTVHHMHTKIPLAQNST
jgi:fatty acid desaturase